MPCARRPAERAAAAAALAITVALAACGSAPPPDPVQRSVTGFAQAGAKALARGDLAGARAQYGRGLAAAQAVEHFELAGAMLLNLALVEARAGDLAAAHARVDPVIASERYGRTLQASAAVRKALLHADAAEPDAALRNADRADTLCGTPCPHEATLGALRARIALERSDAAGALALAQRAARAAEGGGQDAELANAWRLQGRALSALGQGDAAAARFADALALDRRLALPERVALDLVEAAEHERRRGRAAAARDFYERAIVVQRAAGLPRDAERLQQRLDTLPR